jgi:hypothetical protein
MAVQAIDLSRVTRKDFNIRCRPKDEYKTINCKFSVHNKKRKKQVLGAKEILQESFNMGLEELKDLPGNVSLTFEGV